MEITELWELLHLADIHISSYSVQKGSAKLIMQIIGLMLQIVQDLLEQLH